MGTRKLGRTTPHRMSMLYGMVTDLLDKGSIQTTFHRAKEAAVLADKMITLGKKGGLANYRKAIAFLTSESVAYKLFNEIADDYADTVGGYTTVYKLGPRRGDGAEMAILSLTKVKVQISKEPVESESGENSSPKKKKKPEKTLVIPS